MNQDVSTVPPEQVIEKLSHAFSGLQDNVSKAIIGQQQASELLIISLLCSGHRLMVGVPGLAKTLMIRALAQALGWKFNRIEFTPDLMPTDITGTEILQADEQGKRSLCHSESDRHAAPCRAVPGDARLMRSCDREISADQATENPR